MRTAIPLTVLATALACALASAPSYAQTTRYVSAVGSGTVCGSASPCGFIGTAAGDIGPDVGRVVGLNGNAAGDVGFLGAIYGGLPWTSTVRLALCNKLISAV